MNVMSTELLMAKEQKKEFELKMSIPWKLHQLQLLSKKENEQSLIDHFGMQSAEVSIHSSLHAK